MSKEELLKILHDAGMDDGQIEAMLEEIIVDLKPKGEEEVAEPVVEEEDEEAKEKRVFGL